ncbi:hypothetical protein LVJ94_45555 [Pendulispora rubella]|uniref:DUF304 domain-containing protein n=1 Tax=Pendulispora rubella TaxID=2741070 RepID=A0ABZ2KZQ8_9BACT
MADSSKHRDPGAKPLSGVDGLQEFWTPGEFRMVIQESRWGNVSWGFTLFVIGEAFGYTIGLHLAGTSGSPSPTAHALIFVLSATFALLAVLLGLVARVQVMTVTSREIRSTWGRWTRTMKLSDVQEVRVHRISGKGAPSYEVLIIGRDLRPLRLLDRRGEEGLASATAVRDRLLFAIAHFTVHALDEGPYRGSGLT